MKSSKKSAVADKIYAVIDTNVIVSAMYMRNPESPTKIILDKIINGDVTPLYADEIMQEYQEVLSRKQFPFKAEDISDVINAIERFGIAPGRKPAKGETFPDTKDIIFYEVALSKEDSFLVTGNTKHFPKTPIVVTPAEFLEIINQK